MKNVRIIEIDDNNNTSKSYKNNTSFEMLSVDTSQADEAFQDAILKGFELEKSLNLIIDAGGGNDSKLVLNTISENELSDEMLFIIPVMNSMSSASNAIETFQLINKPENTILVLNNYMTQDVKKEFLFFFGSKDYGIDSLYEALAEPNIVAIPNTPLFEIAALNGMTISQMAQISKDISAQDVPYRELFYKESGGDEAEFKRLDNQYKQSKKARLYIEQNLPALAEAVESSGKNKICVVSTKGGAGKSTLSFNLLPLCFE